MTRCPRCGQGPPRMLGIGSERVEEEIAQRFPTARIARMDSDTMQRREDYEQTLGRFANGEVDVLVGTQMIAKGLDFPNVTLVGVVTADAALGFPDFRGAERTFQLIAQVAGRAGRSYRPGHVLVQSFHPDHYAVDAAVRHDYGGFLERELSWRKEFGYPPYSRLVRILVSCVHADRAEVRAKEIARVLAHHANGGSCELLGPNPAPLSRLHGRFRIQIFIKCRRVEELHRLLKAAAPALRSTAQARVMVDVDPVTLL